MTTDTLVKVVLTVLFTAILTALMTWGVLHKMDQNEKHPYNVDKPWEMICQPWHDGKWICNT